MQGVAISADFPLTEVRAHRGAPCLFVDGEPTFALMHMVWGEADAAIRRMAAQGIHLYTTDLPHGWVGAGRYDYAATDAALERIVAADPQVLYLPRVILHAPDDWLDAHPDAVVGYADPAGHEDERGWDGARRPSWASQKWRTDAGLALERLIAHVRRSRFARHIIGWHIGAGIYGEWHYPNAVYHPDTSPVFVEAYRQWLEQRHDSAAPEPRLPTVAEQREGDLGMFRDPVARRWMIEHADFFHDLGYETVAHFARIVKRATAHRSIVLAFNGYLPDLGVNHELDHRAFDRTLHEPTIDAFASPHSYNRRAPGGDAMMRGYMASVHAAGKLWLDEQDDRTHRAPPTVYRHVDTLEASVEILWRGFAQALTHQVGLWYMAQQPDWYDDPAILAAFARMREVAAESMRRPIPQLAARPTKVAVVSSLRTAFYLAERRGGLDHVTDALVNDTLSELARCGVPFDMHLISELAHETTPDYAAYIVLDAFFMSDEEYERICRLRDAGRAMLFFHAPAFVSERGFTLDRMRDLLGMDVRQTEAMTLPNGSTQRPGFEVPGVSEPIVARERVGYSPGPCPGSAALRRWLADMGVHVYLDTDDPLMVGNGYVAVHAAHDGVKTLRLPRAADWTDARTDERLAERAAAVTLELATGQTALLRVEAS